MCGVALRREAVGWVGISRLQSQTVGCAEVTSRIGGGNAAERKRKKIGMTLVRGYPCFLADVMDRKNKRTYHGDDKLVYILVV